MCGSTNNQNEVAAGQQQNFQALMNQAQTEFGDSSQVFGDLVSSFAPVVAAGPGQSGYTPAELSALKSGAITTTGQQYRNAAQAAGEKIAASGGGNAVMPSGAVAQEEGNIATAGAAQTASQLNNIDIQNAEIGRQNWMEAAGILSGAGNVFNSSNTAGADATGGGEGAMSGATQVEQANNQWIGDVSGLIGQAGQTVGQAL